MTCIMTGRDKRKTPVEVIIIIKLKKSGIKFNILINKCQHDIRMLKRICLIIHSFQSKPEIQFSTNKTIIPLSTSSFFHCLECPNMKNSLTNTITNFILFITTIISLFNSSTKPKVSLSLAPTILTKSGDLIQIQWRANPFGVFGE